MNTFRLTSYFIFIASLFSCVEQDSTMVVRIQNKSSAKVSLKFTSSYISNTDTVFYLDPNRNIEFAYGYIPPSPLVGSYDTCRVIFNDTLQHVYDWSLDSDRNILNLNNYSSEKVSETRMFKNFRTTYTITEEDYETAKPF